MAQVIFNEEWMVEYGLMVALIAVVCLTAVSLLGTNLRDIFNQIAAAV